MKTGYALTLSALFTALTGCAPTDPNAPPRYVSVAPPDWTRTLDVNVRKGGADVRSISGQNFRVERAGTLIGNGLVATRRSYHLYITDQAGVECHWDSAERLSSCHKTNPAYTLYMRAHAPR